MNSEMTCEYCNCGLIETVMNVEVEWEDGDDLQNYRVCLDCVDDMDKEEKVIAVWKFGTSVGVDEDEEFDVNDYKDYMFTTGEEEEEEEKEEEKVCDKNV